MPRFSCSIQSTELAFLPHRIGCYKKKVQFINIEYLSERSETMEKDKNKNDLANKSNK